MPLINRIIPHYVNTAAKNVHHVTEDPRPGHDVIYMGPDFAAYNAKTLKRIWGMNLSPSGDAPNRQYIGGPNSHENYLQTTNTDHRREGYLTLAGLNPPASATHHVTAAVRNTDKHATQPEVQMWQSQDFFNKGTGIFHHDNGNGTSNIIRSGQYQLSRTSSTSNHIMCRWTNVKDDEELYEVAPHSDEYQSSSYIYNGPMFWKDEVGDKILQGGIQARGNYFGNYRHRHSYTYLNTGTYVSRTTGNNDCHHQYCGKSEVDGKTIFLELYNNPYNSTAFTFRKFDYAANTWTNILSPNYTGVGNSPYATWNSTWGPASNNQYHRSGANDARFNWGSDWFCNADDTGAYDERYWFMIFPHFDANGQLNPVAFRWDKSNDTIVPVRGDGEPSASYWGHYLVDNQGNRRAYWSSSHNNIVQCAPHYLNICGDHDSTNIHNSFGIQIHGRASYNGSEKKTLDPRTSMRSNAGSNFCTFMQTTGIHNGFDAQPKAKQLIVWRYSFASENTTSSRIQYTRLTSKTDIPETARNFTFLDKDRTVLAAVCYNATYIYQFRVSGDWYTEDSGSRMSQNGQDGTAYTQTGFNTVLNNTQRRAAWVHTATIPYRVAQIGHDKYDRVWYVTDNADPFPVGGFGTTNGSTQLWLLTDDTPMRVDFGGSATTDTITYSGSNIDKTLTIEALNYVGQRLAKTITLKISGSDAQFDNGTQSKNVTCSASGTVSETITVTGNGSFDITAQYGA